MKTFVNLNVICGVDGFSIMWGNGSHCCYVNGSGVSWGTGSGRGLPSGKDFCLIKNEMIAITGEFSWEEGYYDSRLEGISDVNGKYISNLV